MQYCKEDINNGGELTSDGDGSSFSFVSRRKLMINYANIRIHI